MRKKNLILTMLLVIGLLLAPACLAADGGPDASWSLIDWVEDVLSDLFGGDAPGDGGGLPEAGPFIDPAG